MQNTKEEFILQHYQTMTNEEIAQTLNIKPYMIGYYLHKNDIYPKKIFSDDDVKFMKDHYKDMKYSEIAEILGFTERQVRGKINNMGLTKKREINTTYFDNIDTPTKAYFIGFIFADGWVCINNKSRNAEFGMELQSTDVYILEKLNEELGDCNLITHKNDEDRIICGNLAHKHDSDVLRVFSKPIVTSLIKQGIVQNKTLKEIYPVVDGNLFFDFLRGYIDGDGCYYKNRGFLNMHITCATNSILKYIKERLNEYDIGSNIYKENDKKYRLYMTNIKDLKKLLSMLYYDDNVVCLKRKYEIIKSYLPGSAA